MVGADGADSVRLEMAGPMLAGWEWVGASQLHPPATADVLGCPA